MDKKTYDKNMDLLRKKYPDIYKIIRNQEYKINNDLFIESVVVKEKKVLVLKKENKSYYLNSKYEEEKYVNQWVKQYNKIPYNSVIQFFGLGTGDYIKKILEVIEKTVKVIIYEPSMEIFMKVLEEHDLSFLEDEKVALVVDGMNEKSFKVFQGAYVKYYNLVIMKYICYPNYNTIFKKEYKNYMEEIKKHINILLLNRDTEIRFSNEISHNIRENAIEIFRSYSLEGLINILPKEMPAIIVAAGPSLNKNIKHLRLAKGKSLIISTDTALKPLLNEGIIPDIFVTIDPAKPMVLFDKDEIFDIPVLTIEDGNSHVIKRHRGKKFFTSTGNEFMYRIFGKYKKKLPILGTGGSVANNAFSLATEAGLDTIIFVGQDLAYPGNKSHADGTFEDKIEKKDMSGSFYMDVEDIYGGIIRSSTELQHYRKWFEERIRELPKTRFIDATEGGAKICGTEIMSLKEAIEEVCIKEFPIKEYLDKCSKIFSEDEITELEGYILNLPQKITNVRDKVKEGLKLYEKLLLLFKKDKFTSKDMLKVNKRIKKITKYIDNEPVTQLILPYMKDTDYKIKGTVFAEKEANTNEGLEIAEDGIYFLNAMLNTIAILEPEFEKTAHRIIKMRDKLGEAYE